MEQFIQNAEQRFGVDVHAGRGNLTDDVIAVSVGNESGQKVAFSVAETVEGTGKHGFAQGQGIGEATAQKVRVERQFRLAADHADGNERGRIDVACAESPASGIGDKDGLSCREAGKR